MLMGLYKDKVQSIFMGSYILPSADDKKKDQRIKGKGTNKQGKKEREKRSYLSRSTIYLVFDSGASIIRKEEQNYQKGEIC
jgi:hypothetical protein